MESSEEYLERIRKDKQMRAKRENRRLGYALCAGAVIAAIVWFLFGCGQATVDTGEDGDSRDIIEDVCDDECTFEIVCEYISIEDREECHDDCEDYNESIEDDYEPDCWVANLNLESCNLEAMIEDCWTTDPDANCAAEIAMVEDVCL